MLRSSPRVSGHSAKGSSMVGSVPVDDLTVDELGRLGPELGSGGQAVIYDVPDLRLPRAPQRLVYKKYKPGHAPRVDAMRRLIALRSGLDKPLRDRLDTITAWPIRMVSDGADVLGVVLPRIPDSFFQDVVLPASGKTDTIVREVQHLFVEAGRCRRIGMPVPTREQRLAICRDFADALSFLHSTEVDVVFGDINAKNELFRLGSEPMVMFVDCDAARIRGNISGQLNAPDWEPPEGRVLSQATDCYKLGLFVLRCLTPGDQGSTTVEPAAAANVLDATGVALLAAAINGPAEKRPSARAWFRYLCAWLGQALEPPALDAVELDRTMVAAGEPVAVRWAAREADIVEVCAVGCAPVVADGRPGSGTVMVRPQRTGTLTVTARNGCGATERITPPVAVVDVPRWGDFPVPMPRRRLPDLGADALPDISAVLPPTPAAVGTDLPPMAEIAGVWDPACAPEQLITPIDPASFPPGFDVGDTGFPIDLVSIMTSGPDLDGAPSPRGEVVR